MNPNSNPTHNYLPDNLINTILNGAKAPCVCVVLFRQLKLTVIKSFYYRWLLLPLALVNGNKLKNISALATFVYLAKTYFPIKHMGLKPYYCDCTCPSAEADGNNIFLLPFAFAILKQSLYIPAICVERDARYI